MSYLSFVDLSGKTLSSGAFDWKGLAPQCPLWVTSRPDGRELECPLLTQSGHSGPYSTAEISALFLASLAHDWG
jgi:hypothetical protein